MTRVCDTLISWLPHMIRLAPSLWHDPRTIRRASKAHQVEMVVHERYKPRICYQGSSHEHVCAPSESPRTSERPLVLDPGVSSTGFPSIWVNSRRPQRAFVVALFFVIQIVAIYSHALRDLEDVQGNRLVADAHNLARQI